MQGTELATLQARLSQLEQENKELKASVNTSALEAKHTAAIAAKDAEITALNAKVTTLEKAQKDRAKQDADAAVKAAVARGAIPPKDEALQAKWRGLIEQDPSNGELLAKLPGNPALRSVTGSAGGEQSLLTSTATEAEQFVEAVKAKFTETKDRSKAIDAAIAAVPEAYKAWREANGKPGLEFK